MAPSNLPTKMKALRKSPPLGSLDFFGANGDPRSEDGNRLT